MNENVTRISLPSALDIQKRTAKQYKLRQWIHGWLARGSGPYSLNGLSSVVGGTLSVRITSVEEGMPTLATPFVAIPVSIASSKMRGAVVCLPVGLVGKLIQQSLSRPVCTSARGLSTFDNGVLLQLLDCALGDWNALGYPTVELRGLLDSRRQVALYLDEQTAPVWRVQATITGNGIDDDFCIVGRFEGSDRSFLYASMNVSRVAELPVTFHFIIGHCTLDLAALTGVEVGDVLVLDSLSHPAVTQLSQDDQKYEFKMQSGYYAVTARWMDARSIRIKKVGKMRAREQETTISLEDPLDGTSGSLEVTLQVEVARTQITVEEVAKLVPGQILKMDQPVPTHVVVRAKNKSICKGRLVQVEGELAVEVVEVL